LFLYVSGMCFVSTSALKKYIPFVLSFSYLFLLHSWHNLETGVGRRCIVLRFVRGQFDPTSKLKPSTNVFGFHEQYTHLHFTFSSCAISLQLLSLKMNLGNCWCVIFVTNIGIRGLHNSEVWNMGYCWPREVPIRTSF
jgi:hypothetical protein